MFYYVHILRKSALESPLNIIIKVFLNGLLNAVSHTALLAKVTEEDQNLLKIMVPRSRELAHRCTQGLSYCNQVKLDINHWWVNIPI